VRWRAPVLSGEPAWRAVPPVNLHLTLCFLGMVAVDSVPAVSAAVTGAATGAGVAGLALGEVVLLPARRPRVLAVGLFDPGGALGRLQARVAEALVAGGWYEPEARPFFPHVTVARARGGGGRGGGGRGGRVGGGVASRGGGVHVDVLPEVPSLAVDATSVTLFRSRPGPGGARYEALVRVPLG
jgi:2'-5' RNA ligase